MSIEARASPILGKHCKTDPQPPAQGTTFKKPTCKQLPSGPGPKELLVPKLTEQSTAARLHSTMRKADVSGALGESWYLYLHTLHRQSPPEHFPWVLVDLCPRDYSGNTLGNLSPCHRSLLLSSLLAAVSLHSSCPQSFPYLMQSSQLEMLCPAHKAVCGNRHPSH